MQNEGNGRGTAGDTAAGRRRLIEKSGMSEHRMRLAGIDTAVLVGGDGPTMILLPGPGESSLWWLRVAPQLMQTHRVIAPDPPGHGDTASPRDLDRALVVAWLDALVARTADAPAILVGHALGGAIAARYAIGHADRLRALVLVDSLGLGTFFPRPRFAFRLARFFAKPDEARYGRFLERCMFDAGALRAAMGDDWAPFLAYYLERARDPDAKRTVGTLMRIFGLPRITAAELARIRVPTALVWGRHDEAVPLSRAVAVAKRHDWPLEVVEASGDDPKLERPEAFLAALSRIPGVARPVGATRRKRVTKMA